MPKTKLQDVNFATCTTNGYLSICHLTDAHPHLTTFFSAEIIGPKYGFITGTRFGATEHDDMRHWGRFEQFRRPATRQDMIRPELYLRDPLPDRNRGETKARERDFVFLRIKEKFLVPDHTVKDISGASFAGFYYAMIDLSPREGALDPPPTSPVIVKAANLSTSPVARRRQSSGGSPAIPLTPTSNTTSPLTELPLLAQFGAIQPPWSSVAAQPTSPSTSSPIPIRPAWNTLPRARSSSSSMPTWPSLHEMTDSPSPTIPIAQPTPLAPNEYVIAEEDAWPSLASSPPARPVQRRQSSVGHDGRSSPEMTFRRRRESSSRLRGTETHKPEATIRGYYFHSLVSFTAWKALPQLTSAESGTVSRVVSVTCPESQCEHVRVPMSVDFRGDCRVEGAARGAAISDLWSCIVVLVCLDAMWMISTSTSRSRRA